MNSSITILHETPDVLVLAKPAGILVHADGVSIEKTLVDWIMENYPEIRDVGESMYLKNGELLSRPGIVHRLDKDTSGVLVVAKTQSMFDNVKQQFQNHTIQKQYVAYVYGHITKDQGTIDMPIGKSRSDFRRWSAGRGARGMLRPAVTDYVVEKRLMVDGKPFTRVLLCPRTGRTHQLRVHMKFLNHPLVGDVLYAGKYVATMPNLGFTRHALHAQEITFRDLSGESMTVTAPLPDDFVTAQKLSEDELAKKD